MLQYVTAVLLTIVAQSPGSANQERQTIDLLKAAAGEFVVELEVESKTFLDPRHAKPPPLRSDGMVETQVCRILYRTDQAYKVESSYKNFTRKIEMSIWGSAHSSRDYTYSKDRDQRDGEATIASAKDGLRFPSPFFSIFLLPKIVQELESPLAAASWEGEETLEGCKCRILKIRYFKNSTSAQPSMSLYWLDLSKNGLVLRHDYLRGNDLLKRMLVTKFQRFTLREKNVWLPIDAQINGYNAGGPDGKRVTLTYPSSRMHYHAMAQSVQLYDNVDASRFVLTFPPGTTVKDLITKKTYEVGQDRRPPPKSDAETKQRLIEYLAQADTQAKEVRAPSLERGDVGASTLTVVSWVLGGISAVTLVFLSIKRIRNG